MTKLQTVFLRGPFYQDSRNTRIGSFYSYQSQNIPDLFNYCTPAYFSSCQTTYNFWQQLVSFEFSFSEFWPNSFWKRLMQGRVGKRQFARYGYLESRKFILRGCSEKFAHWRKICPKNLHCCCFFNPFIWNVPEVFITFGKKKNWATKGAAAYLTKYYVPVD